MFYVVGVLLLCFLVFIHELGHFLAAKAFKMKVPVFSIGLGPVLFKKTWGETEYRISLLPFGGYVQLNEVDEKDKKKEKVKFSWRTFKESLKQEEEQTGFLSHSVWKRFMVLIMGIVFNLVFAILLLFVIFFGYGMPERHMQVQGFVQGSKAENVLKGGDLIQMVEGQDLMLVSAGKDEFADKFKRLVSLIESTKEEQVQMEVLRDGKTVKVAVPLTEIEGQKKLGVAFGMDMSFVKGSAHLHWYSPVSEFKNLTIVMADGIKSLFMGEIPLKDMSGPVRIVHTTNEVAQQGMAMFLYWTALISINLGIMNALPIPAFDGGQILFLVFEKVFGKRWNHKVAALVNVVFLLLLVALSLVLMYNDFLAIFG